ncbi:MAG: hypothetical protein KKA07_08155 [Bacteroidetes bacterium]|nr:hypothetical protein [Bacteroidota bacterium]MBU1719033.1 hypothetical protein [Bacteroidota bacterium]
METVFRLKASEIDSSFVAMLKKLFKAREVEITVTDIVNDETKFLLKNPKNKAHLLEALEEVKRNASLVRMSGDEFDKYRENLRKG